MSKNNFFTREYYMSPAECNGEQEMPLWLLANRMIEVATLHANSWNVGYKRLRKENQAWVLSRLTIEMERYPKVGENYSLVTWIESYNRHFSERNFEVLDENGKVVGYGRSIWSVINSTTRESCDISNLYNNMIDYVAEKDCPIAKQSKMRPITFQRQANHVFRYSDIDFNRHVNALKYICLILNQWTLDFFDKKAIERFEIAFVKECYAEDEVTVGVEDHEDFSSAEIQCNGETLCRSKLTFKERK